ncbi:MAG: DUF892 family protein [Chloroflexi bacterium]|nr:DUF892 family protein [Chloroflexota bacterium]
MRTKNDVFLYYLSGAISTAHAGAKMTDDMLEETRDIKLLHDLSAHRQEARRRVKTLEEITLKRGGGTPQASPVATAFSVGATSYLEGAGAGPYEKMLANLVTLLKIDQVQIAQIIGLSEIARAIADPDSQQTLVEIMAGLVKEIDRLQGWLPNAVKSTYASIELERSA